MSFTTGQQVFTIVKEVHTGSEEYTARVELATVLAVQLATSSDFDSLLKLSVPGGSGASLAHPGEPNVHIVSACLVFPREPGQEQLEAAKQLLCAPHSYIMNFKDAPCQPPPSKHHHRTAKHHHRRHGHYRRKLNSSTSAESSSGEEGSPESKRLHRDPQVRGR